MLYVFFYLKLARPQSSVLLEVCYVKSCASSSRRLEASVALWEVHVDKPSTHVITSPKLGALREVARDNILKYNMKTSNV